MNEILYISSNLPTISTNFSWLLPHVRGTIFAEFYNSFLIDLYITEIERI